MHTAESGEFLILNLSKSGRVRDQATAGRLLSRGESHPIEVGCFQGGFFCFEIFFEQLRRAAAHFFCQIEKIQAGTKVQFGLGV